MINLEFDLILDEQNTKLELRDKFKSSFLSHWRSQHTVSPGGRSFPGTRVSEILEGNRRITADTALRLAKYFGTSARFWLGQQDNYDLEEEILNRAKGAEWDQVA